MNSEYPSVSVIIPTHNRCASVHRALDALRKQSYPAHNLEVVVVADGCTDDTVTSLRTYSASFELRTLQQPSLGPAAARNSGAAVAKGDLLIFLDDDIEAAPSLVGAHVDSHRHGADRVVIGYLPPALATQRGLFRGILRAWWEAMFTRMRQRGHRFTYQDLLSGNFSVAAALFQSVGGFNTALSCHEDYELGIRLLKAGAEFKFSDLARGDHHETTHLRRSLRRKLHEGGADVAIARLHPELIPVLPFFKHENSGGMVSRAIICLIYAPLRPGRLLAELVYFTASLLEAMRLRNSWLRLVDLLLQYWYWHGVSQELKSRAALVNFLREYNACRSAPDASLVVYLDQGLGTVERQLDEARPVSAELRYGQTPVGLIGAIPGAERLKGAHLRPALANEFLYPLAIACAVEYYSQFSHMLRSSIPAGESIA